MKQEEEVLKRRKHFGKLHVFVWKNLQAGSHTQVTAPGRSLLEQLAEMGLSLPGGPCDSLKNVFLLHLRVKQAPGDRSSACRNQHTQNEVQVSPGWSTAHPQ